MLKKVKFKNFVIYQNDEDTSWWLSIKSISEILSIEYSWATRLIHKQERNLLKKQISYKTKPLYIYEFNSVKSIISKNNLDKIKELEDFIHSYQYVPQKLNSIESHIESKNVDFIDEISGLVVKTKIDINNDTVWLTQEEIGVLFQRDRSDIARHINNIISDGELTENSVCAFFAHTGPDGKQYQVRFYNLDMILAVGYRINSKMGIKFRHWASSVLKRYTLNGFAINHEHCIKQDEAINELSKQIALLRNDVFEIKETGRTFYQGEHYYALTYFINMFKMAKREITIFDPYIDDLILSLLRNLKVKITIYTSPKAQYSPNLFTIIKSSKLHDRYIFIDDRGYLISSSLKDAGKKNTMVIEVHLKKQILIDDL